MSKANGKKPTGIYCEEECGKGVGILEQMRIQQENSNPILVESPLTLQRFEEWIEYIKNMPPPTYEPPRFFLYKSYLENLDDKEFVFLLENYNTMGGEESVTYATERYDKIKKKELTVSKMRRR